MIREIRSFEALRLTALKLQRTHKTNKHTKKNPKTFIQNSELKQNQHQQQQQTKKSPNTQTQN